MSFAVSEHRSLRSGTGLAVALSVQAAIGYALLGLAGVAPIPVIDIGPITPPLEKPKPVIDVPPPPVDFVTVDVTVVEPVVEIEKAQNDSVAAPVLPPVDIAFRTKQPTLPTPPPLAPFVAGRLDPRFLSRFQPPYPSASRRLGEEGSVVVAVLVDAGGRVRSAEVARSSGFVRLDEAAVAQALERWRFIPASRGGEAVESQLRITVSFVLKS